MRPVLAALLLACCLTVAPGDGAAALDRPDTTAVERRELARGAAVLRHWDERRARAWAAVDVAALRALYLSGSRAARRDLRLLRAYAARGLVVRRLTTQVFALKVLRSEPGLIRLGVLDRVAGGTVVGDGRSRALRSSPPVGRVVELRRVSGQWRVAAVSGWERGPRAAPR